MTLPRGFMLRAATMNDIEVVTHLYNVSEIERDGKPESTLDEVRLRWSAPGFNVATDAWIVETPAGQAIAFATVGHRNHTHLYSGGEVHPDYRRRGIGSYLLQVQEERAGQHVLEAPPDVRVVLDSGKDNRNESGQHLLQKHGYRHARSFWRMQIVLNEAPPAPVWPAGVVVQSFVPGMERAVFEADEEAFQDHWGYMPGQFEEWEHWSLKNPGFDASLWFLAMAGNEIAGFALCQEEVTGGWVHVLGVRRPWRRQGLGLALLHQAFGEFYRRGIGEVYLGVDSQNLTGATRLYERAGMHVYRQYNRYEKELRAGKEVSTQTIVV